MAGLRCTAALVVAVAVTVAGCGSNGSSTTKQRREAVNTYLTEVSSAQVGLLGRQGAIDSALQGFSLTRPSPKELAELKSGAAAVDRALRRLRALDPPRDARRLHALLVRRLALQRSVLGGLVQATAYIPKLAASGAPLRSAAVRLRQDLARLSATPSSGVPTSGPRSTLGQYAAAFGRYGEALKPVAANIAALHAPAFLAPGHDSEVSTLRRSISLCAGIRAALIRGDIAAANADVHDLFGGAQAANGGQAAKAQLAAARTYDAEIKRIDALAIRISRERTRLVASIG